MSSNQPPAKDENVFGYTFEDIDHAAASENVTPAGPPLLDGAEFNSLSAFFDNGPFNYPINYSFSDADLPASNDASHDYAFNFFTDPPPTFHGAVAESTQTNNIFAGIDRQADPAFATDDLQGEPSDDVVGAANVLVSSSQPQPGPYLGNLLGLPSPPASAAFTTGADRRSLTTSANLVGGDGAMATALYGLPRTMAPSQSSNPYPFGTPRSGASRPRPRPTPTFGSDSNFGGNGFVAPSKNDTEQAVMDRLYNDLQVLQPADSIPNTRPSSPDSSKRLLMSHATIERSSAPRPTRLPLSLIPIEPTPAASDEDSSSEDEACPGREPAKRRRTLGENVSYARAMVDAITPTTVTSQRAASFSIPSRPIKNSMGLPSESPATKKAKEAQKSTRDNLTEDQKRNNHILSEQKRRNLIKQGFEELNELVPGLRAGGFSKSSVLMEGAKFLEDLACGNQILAQALGDV